MTHSKHLNKTVTQIKKNTCSIIVWFIMRDNISNPMLLSDIVTTV